MVPTARTSCHRPDALNVLEPNLVRVTLRFTIKFQYAHGNRSWKSVNTSVVLSQRISIGTYPLQMVEESRCPAGQHHTEMNQNERANLRGCFWSPRRPENVSFGSNPYLNSASINSPYPVRSCNKDQNDDTAKSNSTDRTACVAVISRIAKISTVHDGKDILSEDGDL